MVKSKRLRLPALLLFSFGLVSCGASSGTPTSYPTLYGMEMSYDYALQDDPVKGRAIYPDEALRILRNIKSHNSEQGIEWPEGRYTTADKDMTIDVTQLGPYLVDEEHYIPGQYYLHLIESTGLVLAGEGYYQLDGEFFHGYRYPNGSQERYYVPSDVEEMEEHRDNESVLDAHYESFLALIDEIETRELLSVSEPQDFECYSSGEGDLYINFYHQGRAKSGSSRRVIGRIVYEDYLPYLAIYQTIDSIIGDDDYYDHIRSVSFYFGSATPREDLDTFFGERREA